MNEMMQEAMMKIEKNMVTEKGFSHWLQQVYTQQGWVIGEGVEIYPYSFSLQSKTRRKLFYVIPVGVNHIVTKERAKEYYNRLDSHGHMRTDNVAPIFVSYLGYEESVEELEQFHMRWEDMDYVEEMIQCQKEGRVYHELLPHNKLTLQNIKQLWKKEDRVSVVQPTGTGKTYVMIGAMELYPGEEKIVFAPSRLILDQTKEKNKNENPYTTYMTYQKILFMTNAEWEELEEKNPSVIVLDEYHRTGARSWKKAVEAMLARFPHAKILGTTATPIRFLDAERDMTEELFYGNIANNIVLEEAIAKSILPMPKYVSALYSIEEDVESLKAKLKNVKTDRAAYEKAEDQIKNFRAKWEQKYSVSKLFQKHLTEKHKKFIVFCKNIEHLEIMKRQVVEWFRQWDEEKEIKSFIIVSEEKQAENKRTIEAFKKEKGSISLLFAVDMLNEGLHLPGIDGMIMLRTTVSPTVYLQQLGRIMTPYGNDHCVVFDLVNNITNIQTVYLMEQVVKGIEKEKVEREYAGLFEKEIRFDIQDESVFVKDFMNKIGDRLDVSFQHRYEELLSYYKEHGHANIPEDNEENPSLGIWVRSLRSRYQKGNVPEFQVEMLKKIGFLFAPFGDKWEQNYKKLKSFYEKHGHIKVPTKEETKSLHSWILSQRRSYKKNGLNEEQLEKLKSLGFSFHVYNDTWEKRYQELQAFYKTNGHTMVTDTYENKALVSFVRNARRRKETLTEEQKELLDDIDFIWSAFETRWYAQYEELKKYVKEKGHANVPQSYHGEGENSLGNWVVQQRKKNRKNELSEKYKELLDRLGFLWEV